MNNKLLIIGDYVVALLKSVIEDNNPPKKPDDVSWDDVYNFSKFHNVSNMVYYAVSKLELSNEELAPFYEDYKKYTLREARQEVMTLQLMSKFDKAGIKCLPMKGHIIKRFYPIESMRYSVDVDVYYDVNQSEKLNEVMINEGFELKADEYDQFIYYKKPIYNFEMHKYVIENGKLGYEYFLNIFDRCTLKEGYKFCYDMNENDIYIYSIIHFYKHYIGEGAGLRFILDLYFLRNGLKNLDEEYLQKTLAELGLLEFTKHMEALSEIWFLNKSYDERYTKIALFLYSNGAFGNGETGSVNRVKTEKGKQNSFFKRLFNYLKWWFLGYDDMKKFYPILEKVPVLLPFCWIHKGIKTLILKPQAIKKQVDKLKLSSTMDEIYELSGINKK